MRPKPPADLARLFPRQQRTCGPSRRRLRRCRAARPGHKGNLERLDIPAQASRRRPMVGIEENVDARPRRTVRHEFRVALRSIGHDYGEAPSLDRVDDRWRIRNAHTEGPAWTLNDA